MENKGEGQIRPGVGVLIQNEKGEFLFGLRKGSFGEGQWAFPGGHIDFGETIIECAQRELKEELGIDFLKEDLAIICVFDELSFIDSDNRHGVGIGLKARYSGQEIKLMEPEKCVEWKWFSKGNLPSPIYKSSERVLSNFLENKIYHYE
ncbi:NUDIX domain-containing protein [Candidatus Nomurabacteria bacterium]|nr:NUDIX domain-containing protein [Candidatus Nomurabacteria bacterium]